MFSELLFLASYCVPFYLQLAVARYYLCYILRLKIWFSEKFYQTQTAFGFTLLWLPRGRGKARFRARNCGVFCHPPGIIVEASQRAKWQYTYRRLSISLYRSWRTHQIWNRYEICGALHLPVFLIDLLSHGDSVYSRENSFEILGTPVKTCLKCTETLVKTCWNFGSRGARQAQGL